MRIILIIIGILFVLGLIKAIFEWISDNPVLVVLLVLSVLGFIFFRSPAFFICDAIAWLVFLIGKAISYPPYKNANSHHISGSDNEDNTSYFNKKAPEKAIHIPDEIPADIRESLIKCNDMLEKIKKRNINIPDVTMTEKLNETERLLVMLIKAIIENPNRGKKLSRFSDYYLPTTEKLLSQYESLERSHSNDCSTLKIREDIISGIDTLNNGISSYLTQIQEYKNMDIETDVDVMKNLMHQDGFI